MVKGSPKYGQSGWYRLPQAVILDTFRRWERALKAHLRTGIKTVFTDLFGEQEADSRMLDYDTARGIARPSRRRGPDGKPVNKAPRLA